MSLCAAMACFRPRTQILFSALILFSFPLYHASSALSRSRCRFSLAPCLILLVCSQPCISPAPRVVFCWCDSACWVAVLSLGRSYSLSCTYLLCVLLVSLTCCVTACWPCCGLHVCSRLRLFLSVQLAISHGVAHLFPSCCHGAFG